MSSNAFNELDREYTEREDYLANRAEERKMSNDKILAALREALDSAEQHPDFPVALGLLKVKAFLAEKRVINEN